MSSTNSNRHPVPVANISSSSIPRFPLPTEAVAKWELGVSLILHNWRVLTDAVAGEWGGSDSADKRDWLCGAIADMFTDRVELDEYDLEDTLIHAMEDEFMVNLEDDSAWQVILSTKKYNPSSSSRLIHDQVSQRVVLLRKEILEGNFSTVDELHTKFLANPRNRQLPPPVVQEVIEEAGSSEDEADSDEEMSEAPSAEEPRQRLEPIIDEEGFELVQKRGNRNR